MGIRPPKKAKPRLWDEVRLSVRDLTKYSFWDQVKLGIRDLRTIHQRRAQLKGKLRKNYVDIMDFIVRHQPVRFFPYIRFARSKRHYREKKISSQKHFSRVAKFLPRYLETEETNRWISEVFLTEMRKTAQRTRGSFRVASTGCGPGFQELFAATRFPQARIDAIDNAKGNLVEAQRIKEECKDTQVTFRYGEFENSGLPFHSYDLVVTFNAIQWVGKRGLRQALQQQKNLLKEKPTSRLLVNWIPHHASIPNRSAKLLEKPTLEELKAHQIPRELMIKTAEELGLEVEKEYTLPKYVHEGIAGPMPLLVFKLKLK